MFKFIKLKDSESKIKDNLIQIESEINKMVANNENSTAFDVRYNSSRILKKTLQYIKNNKLFKNIIISKGSVWDVRVEPCEMTNCK